MPFLRCCLHSHVHGRTFSVVDSQDSPVAEHWYSSSDVRQMDQPGGTYTLRSVALHSAMYVNPLTLLCECTFFLGYFDNRWTAYLL